MNQPSFASGKALHKLLIIEDDLILQKIMLSIFEHLSCQLTQVRSVADAIQSLTDQNFDLVICDLGLLDGTGVDVISWARTESRHPNQDTPFIVLTSNTDPNLRMESLRRGFQEILQKPLTPQKAKEIINKYIHQTHKPELTLEDVIDVIDIPSTIQLVGGLPGTKEILDMLTVTLLEDKNMLETLALQNNILKTREILHRLDGSFRYCIVPTLQKCRTLLHEAIANTDNLAALEVLYNNFYQAIAQFVDTHAKLKEEHKL